MISYNLCLSKLQGSINKYRLHKRHQRQCSSYFLRHKKSVSISKFLKSIDIWYNNCFQAKHFRQITNIFFDSQSRKHISDFLKRIYSEINSLSIIGR